MPASGLCQDKGDFLLGNLHYFSLPRARILVKAGRLAQP